MKNTSITMFSQRLINCLTDGGHAGHIDKIVTEIAESALSERLEELKESAIYVHSEQKDLNEKLDENGISRFRLAESEEGACMVPDRNGYWARANQTEEIEALKTHCDNMKNALGELYLIANSDGDVTAETVCFHVKKALEI